MRVENIDLQMQFARAPLARTQSMHMPWRMWGNLQFYFWNRDHSGLLENRESSPFNKWNPFGTVLMTGYSSRCWNDRRWWENHKRFRSKFCLYQEKFWGFQGSFFDLISKLKQQTKHSRLSSLEEAEGHPQPFWYANFTWKPHQAWLSSSLKWKLVPDDSTNFNFIQRHCRSFRFFWKPCFHLKPWKKIHWIETQSDSSINFSLQPMADFKSNAQ